MRQPSHIATALLTPQELAAEIGRRAKALRLSQQLRQADVAARARVSLATVQRFEASGEAAFGAVVRIAYALGAERALLDAFALPDAQSIAELNLGAVRQRAHRRPKGSK